MLPTPDVYRSGGASRTRPWDNCHDRLGRHGSRASRRASICECRWPSTSAPLPREGPIALIAAIMDRETFTIGSSRFGGNIMDIRSTAPAIAGQMRLIQVAIEGLRKDPKVPPINMLSPGQLYKRTDKFLEAQGFTIKERPSRSTFERFRKQYGATFGIL
jgi:hypothetical protein